MLFIVRLFKAITKTLYCWVYNIYSMKFWVCIHKEGEKYGTMLEQNFYILLELSMH